MKYIIPNWLLELANKVARVPYAKKILKPFYYPYKEKMNKKRNKNFKKYALESLYEFDKCMTANGYSYSLTFGSLLGAIREKGFISHDLDIDVMLPICEKNEKLHNILQTSGFKLLHRFSIDNGLLGCEESYVYKETNINIDIFYIYPPIDDYPYVCCWNNFPGCTTWRESVKKYGGLIPRRIELPIDYEIERVSFENIEINIPSNFEQILEFSYGSDFMIPNPNYVVPKEHRYIWNEKIAIYENFESVSNK